MVIRNDEPGIVAVLTRVRVLQRRDAAMLFIDSLDQFELHGHCFTPFLSAPREKRLTYSSISGAEVPESFGEVPTKMARPDS